MLSYGGSAGGLHMTAQVHGSHRTSDLMHNLSSKTEESHPIMLDDGVDKESCGLMLMEDWSR